MKVKLALIGVGSVLVLTVAWYLALWKPASAKLDDAKARETVASERAATLNTELARLQRLEANADVLERDREALAARVPDADKLDEFILQLNEVATTTGITLQSLSPGEPTTANQPGAATVAAGPIPIALQMSIQGDYHAILRFMDAVRDNDRLVVVDNLSLSQGGEDGQMSASIGGRMFIERPAAPAASTATATDTGSATSE